MTDELERQLYRHTGAVSALMWALSSLCSVKDRELALGTWRMIGVELLLLRVKRSMSTFYRHLVHRNVYLVGGTGVE